MTTVAPILGYKIDSAAVIHPKFGRLEATLYHVPNTNASGHVVTDLSHGDFLNTKEHYRLDMLVGGKTQSMSIPTLADAKARMATLKAFPAI